MYRPLLAAWIGDMISNLIPMISETCPGPSHISHKTDTRGAAQHQKFKRSKTLDEYLIPLVSNGGNKEMATDRAANCSRVLPACACYSTTGRNDFRSILSGVTVRVKAVRCGLEFCHNVLHFASLRMRQHLSHISNNSQRRQSKPR